MLCSFQLFVTWMGIVCALARAPKPQQREQSPPAIISNNYVPSTTGSVSKNNKNNNKDNMRSLQAAVPSSSSSSYIFAFSPKALDNPYFVPAIQGCQDAARAFAPINVTCLVVGTQLQDPLGQANILLHYIRTRSIQGLAVSVADVTVMAPVIQEAVDASIPVITFDSDAPNTGRTLFIGTDNYELGYELGNVAKQLQPQGGIYAVIGSPDPNILERQRGIFDSLQEGRIVGVSWNQVSGSPSNSMGDPTRAMMQAQLFVDHNNDGNNNNSSSNHGRSLNVLISCMGSPMRSGGWRAFAQANPNLTLISGDAMENQVEFLDTGAVSGLVGQLPYDMGKLSLQTLYEMVAQGRTFPNNTVITTNIVKHVRIPIMLPPLVVNLNLIGNLRYVGFVLFGILASAAAFFATWMYRNRKVRVVRVAQPMFLIMVAAGVLIMGTALIPLSLEDDQDANTSNSSSSHRGSASPRTAVCMSIPWLVFTGFTTTFSALFAKTWRVNHIFRSKQPFQRVEVSASHVMGLFLVLLTANWIILACWTALDPLTYVRLNHHGTDAWGRILSTYGICQSNHVVPFIVPLAVINFGIMAVANWQAYEARLIEFEFSESKHIALAMGSFLQASLFGVPLLFVMRTSPPAYYLCLTFLLFCIGMAILLLIFVPKMIFVGHCYDQSEGFQNRIIRESIVVSQRAAMQRSRTSLTRETGDLSRSSIHSSWLIHPSDRSLRSSFPFASQELRRSARFGNNITKKNIQQALSDLAEEGTQSLEQRRESQGNSEHEIVFEKESSAKLMTAAGSLDRTRSDSRHDETYGCDEDDKQEQESQGQIEHEIVFEEKTTPMAIIDGPLVEF